MRNALLFVALLAFVFVSCETDTTMDVGEKTSAEINETFDAGTVIKGEIINATFTMKNTGEHPLVIAEVKGGCTCTVADYPKKPIPPGESGEIFAQVNTDKTGTGKINKSIRIVANTEDPSMQVYVKANVKPN